MANQKMSSWVQYYSQLGATHVTITVAITFGLFAVLTILKDSENPEAFGLLSFVFFLLWSKTQGKKAFAIAVTSGHQARMKRLKEVI